MVLVAHPGRDMPTGRERPAGPAEADPWLELERVVGDLARLVLGADSLAARSRATTLPSPGQLVRLARLQAAVDAGRQAIAAAVDLS